ncbi:NAD(P)-dependent oxidoreductase [Sphingomonas sp. KR1UV-12]|uniref:NAD(P)-dependent oxidoreductase n=1 Tax=Sphingomonas aurea TaxID=3063994 RepID=A0ABT9EPA0_9SPHN|nr:NAD(P)-dependent oxidoreductase [Sphingomonas sp. KR1UV-12]MDP1028795.1 NAD(P)-dependent oxidoreductase [Sphingomonas sp. KR1UV-12]
MTIAVTGAAGFIGRHLVRALVDRGADVTAVVRRMPDTPVPGARYVTLDLADADAGTWAALGAPDRLVHLAWGGLPDYRSRHHFERELPLHYGFLRTLVEAGLPAMLVAGTCYEYGMIDGALAEDAVPQPANPYAFAKAALLRQLQFLQDERGFALTWARLFYMWGSGQAPRALYPLLGAAIARGDATFPMSAGEQLRDYLPVDRVAALLAALALRGADDGVVNISSGQPVSVRALVERWIAEAGATIVPELGRYPYPDHEPLAFWGATVKRRALLGDDPVP